MSEKHKIVVVGGGAAGLELVSRLGRKLGKRGLAEITLIDAKRTHIWKPLLHEVAAGSLDVAEYQLEYLAQAHWRHFKYRLGRMAGLDRERKLVHVAPTCNAQGEVIIPDRQFAYDTLIIAVGSVSNDFQIKGVREHCLFLDTLSEAESFQRRLLETLLHIHTNKQSGPEQLGVAIIGAGATGVELTAQLHQVTRQLNAYGLDELNPEQDIRLHLIEAGSRILPQLPEAIATEARQKLEDLGVHVHENERVVEVTEEGIHTQGGDFIQAGITVWAAGIKAPDFLHDIDGLETNNINQLVVSKNLQTTRDPNIFALGDCAACPDDKLGFVPPRAQAAHQQASFLAKNIERTLIGKKPVREYQYHDYGSLITLGRYSTVGSLMGQIPGSIMVSGFVARTVYLSLHKMHQIALFGWLRTALLTLAHLLRRGVDPEVKLH
jgi:NADH dehydrogenase